MVDPSVEYGAVGARRFHHQRQPVGWRRPGIAGVVEGLVFGAAVFALMLAAYYLWLEPGRYLAAAGEAIARKVASFGIRGLPAYVALGCFYSVIHSFRGLEASAFHAVSLLLHAVNAVLAYLLVFRLFKSRTVGLITGLLLGLHPIHVDAVAWASDLKDVMSGTFVFLTLLAYVQFTRTRRHGWYWLSLSLYALALLSKPMAALLAFLLLIVDYQQRLANRRHDVLEKVPYLLLAVILGWISYHGQTMGTAARAGTDLSFYSSSNAWSAFGFYIVKLISPARLSVLYGSEHVYWWSVSATVLCVTFVSMTVWMLMLSRDYGFGLAWFVLFATPILGFIPFGYVVRLAPYANHFMYLADVGLFVCAGLIVRDSLRVLPDRVSRITLKVISVAVLVTFAVMTWVRCSVWKDSVALWTDAIRYNTKPNATIGHYRLAQAQLEAGRRDEAIRQARLALKAHPGNTKARALLNDLEAGE